VKYALKYTSTRFEKELSREADAFASPFSVAGFLEHPATVKQKTRSEAATGNLMT
jgi:hypothetical protein